MSVGETADDVRVETIGGNERAEAIEVRHLSRNDRTVGTNVLFVNARIEATRQLRGDLFLQSLQIPWPDGASTLELRPGQRFRRFGVMHHPCHRVRMLRVFRNAGAWARLSLPDRCDPVLDEDEPSRVSALRGDQA